MWLQILMLGVLLGLVGTFFAIKFFPLLGLLDFPERYNLKREKVAYPGGVVLSVLALGLAFFDSKLILPAILSFILLGVSFYDDRNPISAKFRFLLQLILIFCLVFSGLQITFIGNPFTGTNFELGAFPLLSIMLSVVWLLLIQNAINFLDGIKGVSLGVSGLGFLVLGILGVIKPELFLDPSHQGTNFASFYLAGLCAGAYFFYAKGKIILGDSGSQVLGFWLGVLSLISGAKVATTLLVLGVPMLDAILTIFRRIFLEKKKPWQGDSRHLHHLLQFRYSETTARRIILFLSLSFGTTALFFNKITKLGVILILFVIISWLWASTYRYYRQNQPE